MIYCVFMVFVGCFASALSHHDFSISETLKEEVFTKCADMSCKDPTFVDKEVECHIKLSEEDQLLIENGVKECYGVSDTSDVHKLMEMFCEDIPKSFECHKKIVQEFMLKDHSEAEETTQLMDYVKCIGKLYEPCMH